MLKKRNARSFLIYLHATLNAPSCSTCALSSKPCAGTHPLRQALDQLQTLETVRIIEGKT